MIQRVVTVAALVVNRVTESKPPEMSSTERETGCYWSFGGSVESDNQTSIHTYVLNSRDESEFSPTDAQIERRVKLLTAIAEMPERPSGYHTSGYIFASFDGCYYLALHGSPSVQSRTWTEVEKDAFDTEVYRVAVIQLTPK